MEWVLEALAIAFVAVAAVWFVVAQAYVILNGIRETREARRKRTLPKHRPFWTRTAFCGLVCWLNTDIWK
jgi:hypothetical protein